MVILRSEMSDWGRRAKQQDTNNINRKCRKCRRKVASAQVPPLPAALLHLLTGALRYGPRHSGRHVTSMPQGHTGMRHWRSHGFCVRNARKNESSRQQQTAARLAQQRVQKSTTRQSETSIPSPSTQDLGKGMAPCRTIQPTRLQNFPRIPRPGTGSGTRTGPVMLQVGPGTESTDVIIVLLPK